jgi:hypothetical protein
MPASLQLYIEWMRAGFGKTGKLSFTAQAYRKSRLFPSRR